MDIKTIYLQHGNIGSYNLSTSHIESEIAIVSGDKDEKAIINLGCEPGTIYKVGRPVFDKIYILKNSNQKKKINQLKNDKPIVAFFPNKISGVLDNSLNMINYMEVLKTASLLPNMNFIIKFHPNEDLLFRSHLVNDFNKNKNIVVLHKEHDSIDIINASDICITTFSTTGFESILMDKPLIIMNIDISGFIDRGEF